jgi:hypothetical protein
VAPRELAVAPGGVPGIVLVEKVVDAVVVHWPCR